jgi:hypothetical protein
MIMSSRKDALKWMKSLPDKSWQIDIVVVETVPGRCVRSAQSLVRKAGFRNLVTVKSSPERQYSSGLPRQ